MTSQISIAKMHRAITNGIETLADPQRAVQQQAYMKSAMPYAGLSAPQLRSMCNGVYKSHPLSSSADWQAGVTRLWRKAGVREERYAAIQLLQWPRYRKAWLTPAVVPLVRELIESGAWWDYVDNLASNTMGELLKSYPEDVKPLLYEWAEDPHLWIRRTAILCQLKFYEDVDTDLLYTAIEHSLHDSDFFARKAIGWALRQRSKTAPQEVVDYIREQKDRLSPLSIREGLKVLRKDGYPIDLHG